MHAVYMTPLGLPTFQPDLEKASPSGQSRVRGDEASTFDRTQLYFDRDLPRRLPRHALAARCRRKRVTTRPNGPNSSAIVLSVSVYDCVNNLFVNVAQSSTAVVPNTSPAVSTTNTGAP